MKNNVLDTGTPQHPTVGRTVVEQKRRNLASLPRSQTTSTRNSGGLSVPSARPPYIPADVPDARANPSRSEADEAQLGFHRIAASPLRVPVPLVKPPTSRPSTTAPRTSPEKPWDRLKFSAHTREPLSIQTEKTLRSSHRSDNDALEARPSSPSPQAPSAQATARAILIQAAEILLGHRPVQQLRGWLAPDVFKALNRRAGLAFRLYGPAPKCKPPHITTMFSTEISPTVSEMIAVFHDGTRTRGAGIRMEVIRQFWRATALEIG
ncbi:MAG: Rv3235 family protein [Actinomycetaceae bacterium]|nr:Rv3235 family protein [Actinomycetaceae bacterium]MDY6082743.1 Rv3235 family protein [Actinomycetaceae bacterium]